MKPIEQLIGRYPALAICQPAIEHATQQIIQSYQSGGKLLLCGNGGSCADAAHIVGEMMKSFVLPRKLTVKQQNALCEIAPEGMSMASLLQQGLPAIDLSAHIALGTAFLNDVDPNLCYAQQAFVYTKENDVLIGISTSGNSDNIIKAGIAAKSKGARIIGLTGEKKCRMDGLFDIVIHVPEQETFKIQEYHLPVYHAICLAVEDAFFGGI